MIKRLTRSSSRFCKSANFAPALAAGEDDADIELCFFLVAELSLMAAPEVARVDFSTIMDELSSSETVTELLTVRAEISAMSNKKI